MNIGKRINKRRKQLKLSADDLAAKLGKNRATIYRYESSDIENMPIEILEPLAKVLRVTPAYLMGWETKEEMPGLTNTYPFIPASISAGIPANVESIDSSDVEQITIPDALMGKWIGSNVFITRINGDSMDKVIPDHSLIAVKPINLTELKNGDMVVFSNDYDYSVKYYQKQSDKLVFKPASNNEDHHDQTYSIDDNIKIHGKVVVYIVELD